MYPFIKGSHEQYQIALEDIHAIEKQFDIVFPEDMKRYYLAYNSASTVLSVFDKDTSGQAFRVDTFYSIKHCFFERIPLVEQVMEWDRMDGFIPHGMIPFAQDQGGDGYYCDCQTGEILCFRSDDIDRPEWVCGSFKEFIKGLRPYG